MNAELSQAKQQSNGSIGRQGGAAFCEDHDQEIHLRRSNETVFTFFFFNEALLPKLKKREKVSLKEVGSRKG